MSAEMVEEKAEFGKKPGFFRSFVEKIRNIDVKVILVGVAGVGIAIGLVGGVIYNSHLGVGGYTFGLVALGLLFCGTDFFDNGFTTR